jgi:hypothetical protein
LALGAVGEDRVELRLVFRSQRRLLATAGRFCRIE